MNKVVYGLLVVFLFFWVGCSDEEVLYEVPELQERDVTVEFSVNIPEFYTVETRVNGDVKDMYVLVFNQNGLFMTRKKATLTNQTDSGGKFKVELPASKDKRILHFICNYDWTGFNDEEMLYSNEQMVVALLTTDKAVFWDRQELGSGIYATCFQGKKVNLLRNQAKISVICTASGFVYEGFTMHKIPNKGTVAPFNSETTTFQRDVLTETPNLSLKDAQKSEINTNEKYIFERQNSNVKDITTMIVKGRYKGDTYFYKIDLMNPEKDRYDIRRNYEYKVEIKRVLKKGYSGFEDALKGPTHNNTALDPSIEQHSDISDGTHHLEVEKTLIVLTKPNERVNVWAKYYKSMDATQHDNTKVKVKLVQTPGKEVLKEGTWHFDKATGIIQATGVDRIPSKPYEARFIVLEGDLGRSIRVIMRSPFSFDATINDKNPGKVEKAQSKPANLKFTIPDNFPDELLPLRIEIHTQQLYAAKSGLQLMTKQGKIYYVYSAKQKGVHEIKFKTNQKKAHEEVVLKAEYFQETRVGYNYR